MGKRVDFSARSVISPDYMMDVEDIGTPEEIAKVETYPERVTSFNIEDLTRRVKLGPTALEGANSIIMEDGRMIYLDEETTKQGIELKIGWIVERHLRNGDIMVFNRQPSLHKESMMGHHAWIMPYRTLRLNTACVTPYNADFDGDEMNVHFPQSENARAEVENIMLVPHQIVSPQSNKPAIGIVQDALVGGMLLTIRDTFLDRGEVMQLLMYTKYQPEGKVDRFTLPIPSILKPSPMWTGKQVISLLFPRSLHMEKMVRGLDDKEIRKQLSEEGKESYAENVQHEAILDHDERFVVIRSGELLCGSLCKATIGSTSQSIIHVLCNDLGNQHACNFISDAQRLIVQWIIHRGFSAGFEDCNTTRDIKKRARKVIESAEDIVSNAYRHAKGIDGKTNVGTKRSIISDSELESFASSISNKVLEGIGRIVQSTVNCRNNSIKAMVTAGSKGNTINIAQMIGNVGQQNNEGRRIHSDSDTRTLPCYKHDDPIPPLSSNGFVEHSFSEGLTPQEFFFHNVGGREGLVDTAVKTGETGYIQRKCVKSMESLKAEFNGIVKNSNGEVIEYCYGNDGMDATFIEAVSCPFLLYSDRQILDELYWKREDMEDLEDCVEYEVERIIELRDQVRRMKYSIMHPRMNSDLYVTINVRRLITRLCNSPHRSTSTRLSPTTLVNAVDRLCYDLSRASEVGRDRKDGRKKRGVKIRGNLSIRMVVRSEITTKAMLKDRSCDVETLREICNYIVDRYERTMVQSGEMVGALAAQSLGEPTTQLTLRTFYTAGTSKNVTLGIPRLKELIDATKKMKKPFSMVWLKEPFSLTEKGASIVQKSIEHIVLRKVVASHDVVEEGIDLTSNRSLRPRTRRNSLGYFPTYSSPPTRILPSVGGPSNTR